MAGVSIICCLCGGQFDERALEGAWLDRRCPHCGGKLSEEAYDAAAADVLARHRPQLGKRGKKSLERLALARYYASEWFRLACAGQGSEAPDKGLFGLHPDYDPATGAFELVPADDDRSPEGGWGTSAEYHVFDAIRRDIVAPSSPLAKARLVPALVFPWLPGQKPKQWGAKHRAETDCVLMCETCAVVIEVKRRNHHVRVSRDQRIRERGAEGAYRSASEPIEQVQRGADSFAERQSLYPPERIFKMVVYVEPRSFEGGRAAFDGQLLVSWLDDRRSARFIGALHELAGNLEPIAGAGEVDGLAERLLNMFGNTRKRRGGRIVCGSRPLSDSHLRRTAAMLQMIEKRCRDERSPLAKARLLANPTCEVQVSRNDAHARFKQVDIAGLLLTRTHAVLIDARRWPVHVNTHVPFATVYTGDPAEGAAPVEDAIRHDWDLDAIRYRNRSGSLTLANYAAKCLAEVDAFRERNRVCTLHVFLDPATFFSDCDTFRQKTFLGYWKGRDNNVMAALETLVSDAAPIMSQRALDRLADEIAAIR